MNRFALRIWIRSLAVAFAVMAVGLLIGLAVFYYYNISESWVTPTALLIAWATLVALVASLFRELKKAESPERADAC